MKQKPVFKNTTKGRIQVIQQGIPIWLNPGDVIVGERFRIYARMGLEEVGRDGLAAAIAPPPPVVNDPAPEKSPVQVRTMKVVDHTLLVDDIKIEAVTTPPEPAPETVEIEAMDPPTDVEPILALHLLQEEPEAEPEMPEFAGSGDALKDEIVSDILAGLDDEEDLVVYDDAEEDSEELELESPDDYPFKCTLCDREFASTRGLKSHQRVHNE